MKFLIPVFSRRQQGFTLVEIMVAMVLGILILLAVSEIFINNSRTRGEIERTGRQIENGSYALRLMEDELANAGFWGEAGAQTAAASLPLLCPTSMSELTAAMGYPVQGENGSGVNCAAAKAGSNFIAIRRASTCAAGSAGCAAANSDFHLQVSACETEAPGEVDLAEGIATLDATQRDCSTVAPHYRLLSRIYYVSSDDVLMRAELSGGNYSPATPLVDGIETIRFEYGVDNSGDGQADIFISSPSGVQWANVTVVKASLIARNTEPSPGYTDAKTYTVGGLSYTVPPAFQGYKRQLYSTTVPLRNVAGRRELP